MVAGVFYGLLSQTRLKKLARVLPDNLFHQLGLESVVTRAQTTGTVKFEVRNFSQETEAAQWLQIS
ncbi:hypothetical protein ACD591_20075 [Rufibacter glacialis]|uniref:Uncharacterized protein n=1 Tax=Rufibacter glacialis TaxID=1259555 RepID=A0ABV4RKC4_9BACT|nr:hypothetical protein [Rufibacter glacialis]GGK85355.1 hypothetical protein GCM10011405_36500 [Rufibacter glacialis]